MVGCSLWPVENGKERIVSLSQEFYFCCLTDSMLNRGVYFFSFKQTVLNNIFMQSVTNACEKQEHQWYVSRTIGLVNYLQNLNGVSSRVCEPEGEGLYYFVVF